MLRRLFKDRRGAAAVEFAFVAPLMILLYFGLAELTQGLMAERRAGHIASTLGDLVAQTTQINQSQVNDIFSVGQAIMTPFPTGTLSMRITSVKADSGGTPKAIWSKTSGGGYSPLSGTVSGIPAGLIAANEAVVMSEVTYVFTSPLQQVLPNGVTMQQKYYLKPRKSTEVLWSTS